MPVSLTSIVVVPAGRLSPVQVDGSEPSTSGYLAIARGLIEDIRAGRIKVGDRIPSMAKLARHHGVAIKTAQLAVEYLQRMGIVESKPSSGTWVIAVPVSEEDAPSLVMTQVILERLDDQQACLEKLQRRLEHLEVACESWIIAQRGDDDPD